MLEEEHGAMEADGGPARGGGGWAEAALEPVRWVRMLCRELGTDLSHAAAIGDSENDLEMLRAVELPIAMGNASDAVKAICKRQTLTNAEDGVAAAIDRILAENG